jgi:AraC-like DNA-binding protein
MRRYIERNLRDPALDSDCLRRNLGASRATVYRDFAADGGVAHYIMDRRLERALSDLVQQTPMRGLVTAVAQDWHFDSVSHFSQRFRQKFGVSPSDMVALAAPTAEAESGAPRAGAGAPEPQRAGNLSTWFRMGCA